MNRRWRYGMVGTALLALAGMLAGCGMAGPGGTPTPQGLGATSPPTGSEGTPLPVADQAAGPQLVYVPEGAMAARPDLAQAPATLTVSGRLLQPVPSGAPVLQTFYVGDPPSRPAEGRFQVEDPRGLLPAAASTSGPLLTLSGPFVPTTTGGIQIGTLEAQQITPLTLDEAGLAKAGDTAIAAAAPQLAAADYAGLALPGFAASTATWKPQAADFTTGGSVFLGLAADGTPITVWRGPALPPDRPLVTRWPVIYALHQGATVQTLIVTIEGQAEE